MRSLFLIVLVSLMSSCVMDSTIATRKYAEADDDRDHSNDDPMRNDPNSLPLIVRSNSASVTTKISEDIMIPVRVKAQDDFNLNSISVSLDAGDINQKYTKISVDKSSLDISSGEEKVVNLRIVTETMSASFSNKKVRVTLSNNSSDRSPVHYDFKLTVLPEVEIKLLKAGSPHTYSLPSRNKICFRDHGVPLKVSMVNQSDDFEQGMLNWRLHSAGRFAHSSSSEVIRKGQKYDPRIANAATNRAPFYNHTDGSGDNRSRMLYFKVPVGEEDSTCDE